MKHNIAIILSGGIGNRMGNDIPKQYMEVNGKAIVFYCIERFVKNKHIHGLIVAADPRWKSFFVECLRSLGTNIPLHFSIPGETRQYTIYNALKVADNIYTPLDTVIIHDAVRPLVTDRLINECVEGCEEYDGVMPVLPMKDTVYESMDGIGLSSILNREVIFAGQAPEAFNLGKYIKAHVLMSHNELVQINGSTELAYKAGLKIKMIPGDERNFKITVPEDFIRIKLLLEK